MSSSTSTGMASNLNSRQTAISVPGGDFARIVLDSMSTTASATFSSAVTTAIAWRQRISGAVGERNPVTYAKFSGDTDTMASSPASFIARACRAITSLRMLAPCPYAFFAPYFLILASSAAMPMPAPAGSSIAPSTRRIGAAMRSSL